MGPKEKIERLAQTPEDRVLLARVWERLSAGQRREIPAFSCFLCSLVWKKCSRTGTNRKQENAAVKPPLYRQKEPCSSGTHVTSV